MARTTVDVDLEALDAARSALHPKGVSATINAALRDAARRAPLANFDVLDLPERRRRPSSNERATTAITSRTRLVIEVARATPGRVSPPALVDTGVWSWVRDRRFLTLSSGPTHRSPARTS